MSGLRVVPLELEQANAVVDLWHRHHDPATGHRWSSGVLSGDRLVGVIIVGRPVTRGYHPRRSVEVLRCATDGTQNACSKLYGAAAQAARPKGYESIFTYTLPEEGGASLRAVGWHLEAMTDGGEWVRADGAERANTHPLGPKWRWRRELNPAIPDFDLPQPADADPHLFDLVPAGSQDRETPE